jgi:hypothetical protein
VLLATVVLAGCRMDVDVTVHVDADGSGLVTVVVAADAELLAAEPQLLSELQLGDLVAAGWTVGTPAPGPDGSSSITLSKPFPDAAAAGEVLAEIDGPGGPLGPATVSIDRDGRREAWRFDGSASLTGLDAFGDAELAQRVGGDPLGDRLTAAGTTLADAFGLTVTVELPAPITSATARPLVGDSVTWQPSLADGATTPLQAEAVVRGPDRGRRWRTLAWSGGVALVGVVLVEVGAARWLRDRRRRRNPPRITD